MHDVRNSEQIAGFADYVIMWHRENLGLLFDVNDGTPSRSCIATAFLTDGNRFLDISITTQEMSIASKAVGAPTLTSIMIGGEYVNIVAMRCWETPQSVAFPDLGDLSQACAVSFKSLPSQERVARRIKLVSLQLILYSASKQDVAKLWFNRFCSSTGGIGMILPDYVGAPQPYDFSLRSTTFAAQVVFQAPQEERRIGDVLWSSFVRKGERLCGENTLLHADQATADEYGIKAAHVLSRRF